MRPTFPAENSKFLSAIAENMNILLSTRKYPEQASGVHARVSSAPVYTIETARQPSARLIGIMQSGWANSQMRQKIKSYEPRKSNYASIEPHTVAGRVTNLHSPHSPTSRPLWLVHLVALTSSDSSSCWSHRRRGTHSSDSSASPSEARTAWPEQTSEPPAGLWP